MNSRCPNKNLKTETYLHAILSVCLLPMLDGICEFTSDSILDYRENNLSGHKFFIKNKIFQLNATSKKQLALLMIQMFF